MVIKWTDSHGTQRHTEAKAVNALNLYRGKGRPRNSDYLIEMLPRERRKLSRFIRDREMALKRYAKDEVRSKKASALIWKANAYIWTLVIGLFMLNVLADQMSKMRI